MSRQMVPESEYEIMKILWFAEKTMELGDILKKLPENKWARNTVSTMLVRLCEKGIAAYEKKREGKFVLCGTESGGL